MPLKPNEPSRYDLCLSDKFTGQEYYLKLEGTPQRDFITEDAQNIYIRNVGKRIGDFDEQRSWQGGRGNEYFNEDASAYFDGTCWTLGGHLLPPLKWRYGTGYRTVYSNLADNLSFRSLFSTQKYITVAVTTGAITADACWIWLRRRGNPSDLTLELCTDSGGNPDTVLKTITVSTTTITDVMSVLYKMDWTGTQALSAATTYHIKVYGGSTSDQADHWDVGVDEATSLSKISSAGSSWSAPDPTFSLQIRITDADIARRWLYYGDGTTFYAVSKRDSGNSDHYTINTSAAATENTSTSLGTVTGKPIIVNGTHFFPQGEADVIRRWDGTSTWRDEAASKYATYLVIGQDQNVGPTVWRANITTGASGNVSVSWAPTLQSGSTTPVAWAADAASMLVWNTAIPVGSTQQGINNIYFWVNNGLFVWKPDSTWIVANNKATLFDYGLKDFPSADNGKLIISHLQFLYFSWLFSLERISGGVIDDVGQGWRGPALPNGREGPYSCGVAYGKWLFLGRDAGTSGTSSVEIYDGYSFHEVFRAPASGMRIRDLALQPISGARTKLWIDCGGEMIYITLPLNKANPLYDTSQNYMHEGVLVSSTIDMGAASKLPKLIKALTATTANLDGRSIRVAVDYQTDDRIGKDGYGNWVIEAGSFTKSPEDTVQIGEAGITQFRYRLRLMTDDADVPPDMKGIVPTGFARGGFKQVWNINIVSKQALNPQGKIISPDDFDAWLMQAAQWPGVVHMTSSKWSWMHDFYVIIPPPRAFGVTPARGRKEGKNAYALSLIEA